jgi:hypothetical protein
LDGLVAIEEANTCHSEENWIELREVEGQLEFLKGHEIVFYSREGLLEYSDNEQPQVTQTPVQTRPAYRDE